MLCLKPEGSLSATWSSHLAHTALRNEIGSADCRRVIHTSALHQQLVFLNLGTPTNVRNPAFLGNREQFRDHPQTISLRSCCTEKSIGMPVGTSRVAFTLAPPIIYRQ